MKLFLALTKNLYQLGIVLLILGEIIVVIDAFGGK